MEATRVNTVREKTWLGETVPTARTGGRLGMGAREAERGQCRPSGEVRQGKDWEEKSPLAVTVQESARSVEQFLCMWGRRPRIRK